MNNQGESPGELRCRDLRAGCLAGLTAVFPPGVTFVLGRNGSGKTTLLRALAMVIPRAGGIITYGDRLLGENTAWYRDRLGYAPQRQAGPAGTRVRRYLEYMASLKAIPPHLTRHRVPVVLDSVGLGGNCDRPLRRLSGGERARLDLAQALLNDPEVLLLDDPFQDLDHTGIYLLRSFLAGTETGADRVAVVATNLAPALEGLPGQLLLLDAGRLVWSGRSEAFPVGELERSLLDLLARR